MYSIGIDPGINGAAAAYCYGDEEGPAFVSDAIDMPTMPDGSKRQIDAAAFARWLDRVQQTLGGPPARAIVENVRAMPSPPDATDGERRSMGAASSFRFGFAAGQIRAVLQVRYVPIRMVEPRVWKASFDLEGGDKEGARQLALLLFPHVAHLLARKKDHNRAEAMLLAHYGAGGRLDVAA